jgi:nitrogen fixation protein FixH
MHTLHQVIHTVRRRTAGVLGIAALIAMAASASAAQAPAKSSVKAKPARLNIMLMKPTAVTTGDNQFEVMVNGADGKPVSDADVSVVFVMPAMPAMKMPEMRNEITLKPAAAGTYTGTGQVMMAGAWKVTVKVKRGGKEIGRKTLTLTAK